MKTRLLAVWLLLAGALGAQQAQPQGCPNDLPSAQLFSYTASDTASPAASAEVSTLQIGGAAGSQPSVIIHTCSVAITSSVAATFTLERTGTAASTTSLTPAAINKQAPAAVLTAFKQSNAGSGTVLAQYQIPAGGTIVLDITKIWLQAGGDNVTVRTNSITGTVNINWQWYEQGRNINDPHP